jgi:hypothetical protein
MLVSDSPTYIFGKSQPLIEKKSRGHEVLEGPDKVHLAYVWRVSQQDACGAKDVRQSSRKECRRAGAHWNVP